MKFFSIAIVVLMLIGTSCSIQKRRFNKGWNIEWNRRQASSQNNTEAQLKNSTVENDVAAVNNTANKMATDEVETSSLIRFSENAAEVASNESVVESQPTKHTSTEMSKPKKPKLGQKYERTSAGKVAFITGVTGIASATIGWIAFLSSTALTGIGISLILLGFIAGLVALYFSVRAKAQLDANPGKFNPDSGKKWALIALGVAVGGMIVGVIASLFTH